MAARTTGGAHSLTGWRSADTALIVYVVLLIGIPQNYVVGPLGAAGQPSSLWALGLFVMWVLHHIARRHKVVALRDVRLMALAFGAVVVASYAVAMERGAPVDELNLFDAALLRVFGWLGVLLVAADGIRGRADWRRVLRAYCIAVGFVGVLAIAQSATGQVFIDRLPLPGLSINSSIIATPPRNGIPRPFGTSEHAIEFGQILAMSLGPAFGLAQRAAGANVAVFRLVVALCGFDALLVVSRSAMLSTLIVCLVVAPALTRLQRLIAAAAGAAVLVAAFMLRPGLLGTITDLFTGIAQDNSTRSRTGSYDFAFSVVRENLILGRGFGTFLPRYRVLDNGWLGLLIEVGLVGVFTTLGLIIVVVLCGLRAERLAARYPDRLIYRGVLASVAASALGMVFFDAFSFKQGAGSLFLMMGLLAAAARIEMQGQRTPSADPPS